MTKEEGKLIEEATEALEKAAKELVELKMIAQQALMTRTAQMAYYNFRPVEGRIDKKHQLLLAAKEEEAILDRRLKSYYSPQQKLQL